jgi:RND family efflux transporter MFP subunit
MKLWLNRRSLRWASAGVVLAGATVFSLVILAGAADPSKDKEQPPGRGRDPERETPTEAGQHPRLVRAVHPLVKHLRRETTQVAHIEGYEKVDVQAKASGYVHKFAQVRDPDGKERDLDIGARVVKDQVLAELWIPEMDQERLQKEALVEQAVADVGQAEAGARSAAAMVTAAAAKVEQARSELGRYHAEVAYRKSEYERYRRLLEERTTRQGLVDERLNQYRAAQAALAGAQAALATAQANLSVKQAAQVKAQADIKSAKAKEKVARANLQQAKVLLAYARVRAPFAGVITRRLVDTGTFVQSAGLGKPTPLFTLVRVDRLRVLTDLPETDSAWIKIGQSATLRVDAARGHQYTGKVVRFADMLDRVSRTMRAEVELDGPTPALRPGLYGTVIITLADYKGALTLPTGALVPSGEKTTVMVVKDKVARKREITLGINDGITMQVTGGLSKDDLVITDGKDAVSDGQPVEVAR